MSRRRKRGKQEEPESSERWLVSYADFITLLFAFFVVMYAVSSVNEGKYRVLSESLNAVFKDKVRSVEPQAPGDPVRELVPSPGDFPAGDVDDSPADAFLPGSGEGDGDGEGEGEGEGKGEGEARAIRLSDKLELAMQTYIDADLVNVRRNGDRIEVEMKAQLLFGSGEARLSGKALQVLGELAGVLDGLPHQIQIEGHTDNVPIGNLAYGSNWELSAARAASVVHYLSRRGVAPQRLSAVGLGEYHPVATNGSAAGRARNRRVTLVVLGAEDATGTELDAVPWSEGPALDPPS